MSGRQIIIYILLCSIIYLGCQLIKWIRYSKKIKAQLIETERQLVYTQQQQQDLHRELKCDVVTGLPTRQCYEEKLLQTLHQSKDHQLSFTVLLLRLDDFKIVQHVVGYDMTRRLLKEIAERLQLSICQRDTISRFAHDEFAFLFSQTTKAETVMYAADQLLEAVSQPMDIGGQKIFLTASIGISFFPQDGEDEKILLKNADIALSKAESNGGNAYQLYHTELYVLSCRELILKSSLYEDSIYQQLIIHYQPQVQAETGEIVSLEALLRWQHPELGLVPPGDFLRLAEKSGKMIVIGEWVLRSVCKQFKQWQAAGLSLQRIAVNISVRQLENLKFTYRLSHLLQELQLDPHCLLLEISENVVTRNIELLEKSLNMLRHLGVQIAIDDFGTGYLSLQHLQRFPVHYLKIDNSLVQGIGVNQKSNVIISMIISLANSLQLAVVAEGVETQEQKRLLIEQGCFLMQGYLFSPARPPEDIISLLKQGNIAII